MQSVNRANKLYPVAIDLFHCIQEMGQQKTNPVLDVLGQAHAIHEQKHYPDTPLIFSSGDLRAYYHCHPAEYRFHGEHGHFHIFLNTGLGSESWAHLVGLCMDTHGQPLRWFTINQWVTGGPWYEYNDSGLLLPEINPRDLQRVERWLLNMLLLFQNDIAHLLEKRDQYVDEKCIDLDREHLFRARDIYLLSEHPIDLLQRLTEILSCQQSDE